MLFNSFVFAVFLPLVFFLYWFVTHKNLRLQNFMLLVASCTFYGWWDWKFLGLVFVSAFIDYFAGIGIQDTEDPRRRKLLLVLSMSSNLGILGFFKYFNFFVDSFVQAFAGVGIPLEASTLNIILPVGISFYTFQSMSYTIDIYKRELEPTRNPIDFAAFVMFFPQLVAGPIERAANLLPQFYVHKKFDLALAQDGIRQVFWGLFKKIVIADTCAHAVNTIFDHSETMSGSALLLGALLFTFQIYGDFSGYSDIAIGIARLFGFELMQNFNMPYLSRDIGEFWRRWHISLSTWFRDYVYIPLGGSRVSKWKQIRNVMIVFTVSGFWHGANWTFIFWGFLNGLYQIPIVLRKNRRPATKVVAEGRLFPTPREVFQLATTFAATVLAWIFFRAESIGQAFSIIGEIFSPSLLSNPAASLGGFDLRDTVAYSFIAIAVLMTIEWLQRGKKHGLELSGGLPVMRWAAYFAMVAVIILFRRTGGNLDFIYFQF
ncbi:MAG: MBOAT family O-acyltransferase [Bacteroidia bacterium]|nr:MBOAT family O-acyltransferase [Bacteroidia bacterium]